VVLLIDSRKPGAPARAGRKTANNGREERLAEGDLIMRKALAAFGSILFAALVLVSLPALAQGGLPPAIVTAEQFNNWQFQSQGANQFTFSQTNQCTSFPLVANIGGYFVFGTGGTYGYYPVYIQDASPSNSEIVTPTSISQASGSCGFSASTANSHTSFTVLSGTAGLQDAVGTLASRGAPGVVMIDRYFYNLVTGLPGSKTVGGLIAALKGSALVQVVDTTTAPWTYYSWNGASYYANGGSNPGTLALTAGSGTAPSGATIAGNGAGPLVSYTSGTSTATGSIFTVTTPAAAAGGFNHSPTCTIASIGATVPAGTLSVATSGSGPWVVTASVATTALAASTLYQFSLSCH
jgi:hypothetical protein